MKNCPFCYHLEPAIIWYPQPRPAKRKYAVKCTLCDMQGPKTTSEENAIRLWDMLPRQSKLLIEFIQEVAQAPFTDSDPVSLLETFRARARAILETIEKGD